MNINEFLAARIAEDEAAARTAHGEHNESTPHWTEPWSGAIDTGDGHPITEFNDTGITRHITRQDPARTLAEAKAKRDILDDVACKHFDRDYDEAVKHLATIYDDHPNYQEEWRP